MTAPAAEATAEPLDPQATSELSDAEIESYLGRLVLGGPEQRAIVLAAARESRDPRFIAPLFDAMPRPPVSGSHVRPSCQGTPDAPPAGRAVASR